VRILKDLSSLCGLTFAEPRKPVTQAQAVIHVGKCHFLDAKWYDTMAFMAIITTIDKAGRVVIPKSVRDELHLEPGGAVEIATDGGQVTLRPVRTPSRLRKKQGVWVFDAGEPMPANLAKDVIREIRDERDHRHFRRSR
jgi:AbrB family looped-hinge helix DNA binding protein